MLIPRRRLASLALLALLLFGGVAGCGDDDSIDATPTADVPAATTTTSGATSTTVAPAADVADFDAIMRALLTRRDEAYEQNKPEYLDEIYLPACKCLAGEKGDIDQQIAEGVHAEGPRLTVLKVERVSVIGPDAAVVRVIYQQAAARLVDRDGQTVRTEAAEPPTSLAFTVGRTGGGWKIERIDPEGPADPAAWQS